MVYTEQSEESSDEDSLITLARAPATTSEDSDDSSEDEPPAEEDWETEHRWMHARCAREFDGRVISAKVIRWLPASGSDPALWKIRHADGDEEDLEEAELRDALRLHAARAAPKQRRAKPAARRTAAPPAAAPPQVSGAIETLSPELQQRMKWFDTCQTAAVADIARGDPARGGAPYLKPGNAMWSALPLPLSAHHQLARKS